MTPAVIPPITGLVKTSGSSTVKTDVSAQVKVSNNSSYVTCMVADAVPVPIPTPVAVKIVPGVLFAAPINVKSVVPADTIVYTTPTLNAPAVVVEDPP